MPADSRSSCRSRTHRTARRTRLLDALTLEQVVLRLLRDGLAEVVTLGGLDRVADLARRPLAGPPVQRLAARHDVAHRPHGLLDGRVRVRSVAVEDVDEVETETLQRPVDRLHQVLAVERVLHVHAVVDAPEQLGRHDVRPARPLETSERLAHDLLAATTGIGLGVVEEVASGVTGDLHALDGRVDGDLVVERHPRSERQHRHLDPGTAESAGIPCSSVQSRSPCLSDWTHGDAMLASSVLASAIVCRP